MNDHRPHLPLIINVTPLENYQLKLQEIELSIRLETANRMDHSRSMPTSMEYAVWERQRWEPSLLDEAAAFFQKLKNGFTTNL